MYMNLEMQKTSIYMYKYINRKNEGGGNAKEICKSGIQEWGGFCSGVN